MSYLGGGARMRALACKLMGGGPAKVVFLGGSITAGRGAGDEAVLSYVPRFAAYLNATFPNRWGLGDRNRCVIAGVIGHERVSGTCSGSAAWVLQAVAAASHSLPLCLDSLVPVSHPRLPAPLSF